MSDDTATEEKVAPRELSDAEVVARRSADITAGSSDDHVKVFILGPGAKPIESNGYNHEANKAATRQYMIDNGLRPTGDVAVKSIKKHTDGVSWAIAYTVAATPADVFEGHPPVIEDEDGHAPTNTDGSGNSEQTGQTAGD